MCIIYLKMWRLLVVYWYLSRIKILAWELDVHNENTLNAVTNNDNYTIVHVSIFYVRAFLTIKYHSSSVDR